jgi:glycosyltransferase involved in cell wall biosynthesis
MASRPRISVVIPTHDRASYLESALASLERQTLASDDFEVIVVDDDSSDGTEALCRSWDGEVVLRYHRQPHAGSAVAKNLGLFLSDADVVLFFDDDDVASESFLEEHLKAHAAFPDARVSILSFTTWHPDLTVTPVMDYLVNVGQFLFSYASLHDRQLLGWQHFWTGRISCKRRFLTHFGIFSRRMRRVEDIELGYRLARHGHEIRYWSEARSYMLRPVSFHDFCRRAESDGRALAEMERIHPAPEMVEYCHGDAARRWAEVAGELASIVAAVEALEKVVGPTPSSGPRPVLEALHGLYRQAFLGFAVKGVAEGGAGGEAEREQHERGGPPIPDGSGSDPARPRTATDEPATGGR